MQHPDDLVERVTEFRLIKNKEKLQEIFEIARNSLFFEDGRYKPLNTSPQTSSQFESRETMWAVYLTTYQILADFDKPPHIRNRNVNHVCHMLGIDIIGQLEGNSVEDTFTPETYP